MPHIVKKKYDKKTTQLFPLIFPLLRTSYVVLHNPTRYRFRSTCLLNNDLFEYQFDYGVFCTSMHRCCGQRCSWQKPDVKLVAFWEAHGMWPLWLIAFGVHAAANQTKPIVNSCKERGKKKFKSKRRQSSINGGTRRGRYLRDRYYLISSDW